MYVSSNGTTASACVEALGFDVNLSMQDRVQAEVALHSAGPLLSKVSLIAEEPTLMERVALMLHPSFALKGRQPSPTKPPPPPPPLPLSGEHLHVLTPKNGVHHELL